MQKHTATPCWQLSVNPIAKNSISGLFVQGINNLNHLENGDIITANVFAPTKQEAKEWANKIVKACNMHEELVQLLKDIQNDYSTHWDAKEIGSSTNNMMYRIEQLLQKSKA